MSNLQIKDSLIDQQIQQLTVKKTQYKPFINDYRFLFFVALSLLAITLMCFIQNNNQKHIDLLPKYIQISWPKQKKIIIQLGTSRVLQPLLYSGYDNRTDKQYKQVYNRSTYWQTQPQGIIQIDKYGQIQPLKIGNCKLILKSNSNPNIKSQRDVQVTQKRNDKDIISQRVIKFQGVPFKTFNNLQKIVKRFSKQQALNSQQIPQSVKQAVKDTTKNFLKVIFNNQTLCQWRISQFADGSDRYFVQRLDFNLQQADKNRKQYFIGDRYLPNDGVSPVMIQFDQDNGIWVVSKNGDVNHIIMKQMTYTQKSNLMNKQTKQCVDRHGIVSSANKDDSNNCLPNIQDNDGLWTSIYAAGQLMKYSSFKIAKKNKEQIQQVRNSALRSLKAVLLIANSAGRQGKVQAKIRYLVNSATSQTGVKYSKKYLLKNKQNLVDTYVGLPSDGIGFYGIDSNKTIDGDYVAGQYKFSMQPINNNDWGQTGQQATTTRYLQGFWARTFAIQPLDKQIPNGGLFFKRSNNQNHTVLSGANYLYDFDKTQKPQLKLGNKKLPQVLKNHLNINGTQYNQDDIIYKGDTSTDQVSGHLFLYKIAFDILDQNDEQQKQLKNVIKQTMVNFCQYLINNGHSMVDGTGQATKWGKLYKQFLTSDYTIDDAPLKALQLLMSFKLAYYVSGQRKFLQQYQMLANHKYFKYLDLISDLWPRWKWHFLNNDDSSSGLYKIDLSLNPTQIQLQRHCIYNIHYSDQQQAFLTFYVAFQLQQNPQYLQKYKKGINGYWHSISRTQNPLWYYIYQTAFPQQPLKDSFGQDLRQIASWQLNRHMIDTTHYQAYIKGSRNDLIFQGKITADPNKIIGVRTSIQDQKYVSVQQNFQVFPLFNPKNIYQIKVLPADQRSIHKFNGNNFDRIDQNHDPHTVQGSTTYSTPYWFGVYHNLIQMD